MISKILNLNIFLKTIIFIVLFILVYTIKYYTLYSDTIGLISTILFIFPKSLYQIFSFSGVALFLYIGLYLTDKDKIPYSKLYSITLTSGFVFIFYFFFVIFWFKIIKTEFITSEIENFYPLSLYQLLGANNEAIKAILVDLNLFEIVYFSFIVYFLKPFFNNSFTSSFEFTIIFHGFPFLSLRILSAFFKIMLFQ